MIRPPLQVLCLLAAMIGAPACVDNTQVNTPAQAITLPPGTIMDGYGVLIGPHAGTLTRAGNYFLESVFITDGAVQIYAYDARGQSVPVSELSIDHISLNTNQGVVKVSLTRADPYYLIGYYDPIYYDPFFYGGYPYFYVLYPTVVVIRDTPSTVYRPSYQGAIGSNPSRGGYPSRGSRGYTAKTTPVVVTAQKPVPGYSAGKGSSK